MLSAIRNNLFALTCLSIDLLPLICEWRAFAIGPAPSVKQWPHGVFWLFGAVPGPLSLPQKVGVNGNHKRKLGVFDYVEAYKLEV
jgi:hypothetical protein